MKRIVIMGATSGIGLETAKRCIAAGWRVGAAGRRSEELERLRGLAPQQVETEAIDVTDDVAPAALERLIERLDLHSPPTWLASAARTRSSILRSNSTPSAPTSKDSPA